MDEYIFQTWNPISETWSDATRPPNARAWFNEDSDNRRVLEGGTRRILIQPGD